MKHVSSSSIPLTTTSNCWISELSRLGRVRRNILNRLQTMPQKPYKPPYAHLFQTIYVCRQDLSNNQTSLKKTESAVLISLPLFFHIFDQKQHNFDQFFQKIWKKIFCPKHSVFDGKLNGESIFFGPMVLKSSFFSESGLFHKWRWWFSTQKWHSFLHWNNH